MADADGNNMYEVTVVITDSQANTGTRDVTITLTNVEEDGSVMFSLLHPQVGTQLVASASDPDGDVSGVRWQWFRTTSATETDAPATTGITREPAEDAPTNLWEKIDGATSSSYRPVPSDVGRFLLAVATYADGKSNRPDNTNTVDDESDRDRAWLVVGDLDGSGNAGCNSAYGTETSDLSVRRSQPNNKAPAFSDTNPDVEGDQNDPRERFVDEDKKSGNNVGTPVKADDPDTSPDRGYWRPVRDRHGDAQPWRARRRPVQHQPGDWSDDGGQREAGLRGCKEHLRGNGHSDGPVRRHGRDHGQHHRKGHQRAAEDNLHTRRLNAPVRGCCRRKRCALLQGERHGSSRIRTQRRSKAPTWTLSGVDAGDFSISGGVLSFNVSSPDYEAPTDANTDNVYMVTVMANNGNGGAERDVTVTVTNDTSDDPTTPPVVDTFDPLSYDADGSGEIDRPEVITAIRHYFDDQITRDEVLAVIKAYFGNGS